MNAPGRLFHNWAHVETLVWHAQHTFQFPFDWALGKAVVAHDVIYDTRSQKEWRSAQWLMNNDTVSRTTFDAVGHIMKTDGHQISDDNRMVLLDLGNFMYPRRTHEDFYRVYMETMNLYRRPPVEIIDRSIEFMTRLRDNYVDENLVSLVPMERVAFLGIRTGIERAILMYEESRKGAQRGE